MIDRVKVDRKRFDKIVRELGLTKSGISDGIGRSKNYINNCILEGAFPRHAVIALESVFGIKQEDYEAKEPTEVKTADCFFLAQGMDESEMQPKVELDWMQLYNTIYSAVYEALRKNAKEVCRFEEKKEN